MAQRLPKDVFSVLGRIPLKRGPEDCPSDAIGYFGGGEGRFIAISPDCPKEQLWQTFWHECVHVALYDSGCQNNLTEKQAENVCDAVGTYLAAMMQAGMLRVVTPKK